MKKVIRAAFPHTIPVLTGYVFMGMAFGILLHSKGFGAPWAFVMALLIYAGSGQFVGVSLMAAGFHPLSAMFLTLMVNARHVFYSISMLKKFNTFGRAKWYMIFSLTDETFALLVSAKTPPGISEKAFSLAIAIMNHIYWIIGCTAGGLLGQALPIDTQGIDFVMTALFVVIFLQQWQTKENRTPALIGFAVSLVCRVLFGPQWFVMAAMAAMVLVFTFTRNRQMEGGKST